MAYLLVIPKLSGELLADDEDDDDDDDDAGKNEVPSGLDVRENQKMNSSSIRVLPSSSSIHAEL